jgi:ATP-binding protein involved in chromosome partitioning
MGRMALDCRMPVVGVVENMSGSAFGSGGGQELASTLGSRLLASVPLDESIRRAGDEGFPVVLGLSGSAVSQAIQELAAHLLVTRPSLVGKQLPLFVGSASTGSGAG